MLVNNYSNGYGIDADVIIDGRIKGTWKRTFTKDKVMIRIKPIASLTDPDPRALEEGPRSMRDSLAKELLSL